MTRMTRTARWAGRVWRCESQTTTKQAFDAGSWGSYDWSSPTQILVPLLCNGSFKSWPPQKTSWGQQWKSASNFLSLRFFLQTAKMMMKNKSRKQKLYQWAPRRYSWFGTREATWSTQIVYVAKESLMNFPQSPRQSGFWDSVSRKQPSELTARTQLLRWPKSWWKTHRSRC